MTDDEKLLLNRIKDLAEATYTQNRYSFSQFLTVEEQTLIYSIRNEIKHVDYDFFGGFETSERQIMRFGSEESLGYDMPYPIAILLIEPLMDKFSDDLSHRDFLGTLMGLGLKRNVIGDIVVKGKKAYVMCLDDVKDYIMKEVTRIKHTSVKITEVTSSVNDLERKCEDFEVLVSSNRFDAIVAAVCKLSRSKAVELFQAQKVLLNGRICESQSISLKPGNTFSIRGYGKFIFDGEGNHTKKDRVYIKLQRYV